MAKQRWLLIVGGSALGLFTAAMAVGLPGLWAQPSLNAQADNEDERFGERAIGRTAYGFVVTDVDGDTVDQNDLRGEPYALLLAGADCRWSQRTVGRMLEALDKLEGMRAVVVVLQPQRENRQAPSPEVAARAFARQHVAGKAGAERVRVGTADRRIRVDYGSLVLGGVNQPLNDVPALFTMDTNNVIRGVIIGDASFDEVSQALQAAYGREADDE